MHALMKPLKHLNNSLNFLCFVISVVVRFYPISRTVGTKNLRLLATYDL